MWRRNGAPALRPLMKDGPCSVPDCRNKAEKRTWCNSHYRRWLKTGDVRAEEPLRTTGPYDGDRPCNGCAMVKPPDQYTKRSPGTCLDCCREGAARWRERNPDYFREWRAANPDTVLAVVHARRATREGRKHERVERSVVFERDGFTCCLCGDPLDMDGKKGEPLSPTIDHIVPLSRGGDHLYSNVQAAHFRCNVAKGNRLPTPTRGTTDL